MLQEAIWDGERSGIGNYVRPGLPVASPGTQGYGSRRLGGIPKHSFARRVTSRHGRRRCHRILDGVFWLTPDTYRTGSGAQNLSVGTDPLTANTYTYVNGDPINLSDPTGHGCIDYGPCGQRPVRKLSRDAYQIITDFHAKRTPKQYQKAGRAFSNYEIDKIMAAWETACARWKCPSGNEIIEWAFRGRADMESRRTHLPGWRTVVETVGIIPGIDTIADAVLCANSAFKRNAGGIAVDWHDACSLRVRRSCAHR